MSHRVLQRPARRGVSLERALSKLGLASRGDARALILAGRVSIDGRRATDPSARVVPEQIAVAIDGRTHARRTERVTILLHKPRGYVTTASDPEGRPTVYDLLDDLQARVIPVGRLDRATSGLLLLTNDTQFANWLTDPASEIPRVYLVAVKGRVAADSARTLEEGIVDRDERLQAAHVVIRKPSSKESHLTVTLIEGKNREIRRLFAAVGHPVIRLRRVAFGGLELGDLPPGHWRRVSDAELRAAFARWRQTSKRVPRPK
jgi:23S rRNA pseudouridine2605 synthase